MSHPTGPAGPAPGGPTGPGREVEVFQFPSTGQRLRTLVRDGEPWFVLNDVGAALELANPHSSAALLDEDERAIHTMETASGEPYPGAIISEAGLYSLILRSRKPEAKAFKRWITHDVLPAIRRTGRYEAAPTAQLDELEVARRYVLALEAKAAVEAELAEAAPKARSWDTLASGDGDYSVSDAAKILSRDPVIAMGERRLFRHLSDRGWIYRAGDGRWRPYQGHVEAGRLSEMPSSHYHPRTGELVLDPPQVRVTPKGLAELHRRLGGLQPLRAYEQIALLASKTPADFPRPEVGAAASTSAAPTRTT